MQERGHTVAVACGGQGELVDRLTAAGVTTFEINGLERDISIGRELRALYSLAQIIRTFDPDLIHLNSTKAGVLGAITGRLLSVPRIIFTAHGWPFREKRSKSWQVMAWAGSYLTALLAHHTIEVSKFDHANVHMPGTDQKRTVIPPAISSFPLLGRTEARTALMPAETITSHLSNIWLVTIAELNHNKNHTTAIDAVAEFNSTHANKIFYTILGAGELEAALKEQVALRGLSDYVHFHGHTKDARQYLLAFDIFLLPSKKEGLPYALLEAGLAEVPCVASNVGGIGEVITDQVSGILINPDNHMSIVSALEALLQNPDNRTHFATALRAHIEDEYSSAALLERIVEIYAL
jgi:glycosyltransferase involved in cell wall biosynthesis